MKRFWKEAAAVAAEEGFAIELDGRRVRTPAGMPLAVPSEALAEAIADEWAECGEEVDPRRMRLTGLANAAIDWVAADPEAFAAEVARYANSDLTCYRAESPEELARRQQRTWDQLLNWARRRYDIDFACQAGVVHVEQPAETVRRLGHEVAVLDPFRLSGLSSLVAIGGSLVAGLAVLDGAVDPEEAWVAVTIDEAWQSERWGEDEEAAAALDGRRRDFLAAAAFLALLDSGD